MKKIVYGLLVVNFLLVSAFILLPGKANASVNYNRLIEDSIFSDFTKMSASQIDSWLNDNFPNSCISTHKQFKAAEPVGYTPSGGYKFGSNVSAGKVIYVASKVYGINPQVLLATLQKEQGYVSGPGTYNCTDPLSSSARKGYAQIMGYGCPDGGTTYSYSGLNLYTIGSTKVTSVSGTCVNNSSRAGFSQQIIRAAWLLKFTQQRSLGNTAWNAQLTNYPHSGNVWDNSDDPDTCYSGPMTQGYRKRCSSDASTTFYDGYTTIDGSSVHMDTGGTAALYRYTPHKSGNLHFFNIFSGWFGNPIGTFKAANYSRCCHIYSLPGVSKSITLKFKNSGSADWYDEIGSQDSSVPFGTRPVMLMTSNPIGRDSKFASDSWSGKDKPNRNFTAVYNSNGTTLASNQHQAMPGQIVKYSFSVVIPANVKPSLYKEYFQPVVFQKSSLFNNPRMHIDIEVLKPTYKGQILGRTSTVDASPGDTVSSFLRIKNTGNMTWYDDIGVDDALPGFIPTMLVTSNPLLHYHPFGALWGSNRNVPTRVFQYVRNSDNTVPADPDNQHFVKPGQWANLKVDFYVPNAARDQLRKDYFMLVGREKISGHWKIIPYSSTQTYLQVKVN